MPRPTATAARAFVPNLPAAAWQPVVLEIPSSHGFQTLSTYGFAFFHQSDDPSSHAFSQWMESNGWTMIGTQCCGPAGSVVIYDETSAGNDHAAFSVGGGLICQHNPGRCRCFLITLFLAVISDISRTAILQYLRRLGQAPCLLQRLLNLSRPPLNKFSFLFLFLFLYRDFVACNIGPAQVLFCESL
jgi:hypothetical protein